MRGQHNKLAPIYDCKRLFVQRYVTRAIKPDVAAALMATRSLPNRAAGDAWKTGWKPGSSPSR